MAKFQWNKLDDLILFAMMLVLIGIMGIFALKDAVTHLASALMGAATMYLKGK